MTMKTTARVDVSLQSSVVSQWWTIDAAVMFDFASRRILPDHRAYYQTPNTARDLPCSVFSEPRWIISGYNLVTVIGPFQTGWIAIVFRSDFMTVVGIWFVYIRLGCSEALNRFSSKDCLLLKEFYSTIPTICWRSRSSFTFYSWCAL